MSSTFTNLLFHVVYSTKYREPLIQPAWNERLFEYIGGIIRGERGILLEINGTADHIHLLAKFSPTIAVSDMLRLIKTNSSKWVHEERLAGHEFQWQTGYGGFSVSQSQIDRVRQYIQNQQQHHERQPFKEEFLGLLRKHNIEFDERYVFEEEHIV
jgi:REP element-mobilizing transposase RayT